MPRSSASSRSRQLAVAQAEGATQDALGLLDATLTDPQLPFENLLDFLSLLHEPQQVPDPVGPSSVERIERINVADVPSRLIASDLEPAKKAVALHLWHSLSAGRPVAELVEAAGQEPPPRFANHAVGVFWEATGSSYRAAEAFEREGRLPAASAARKRAVAIYVREDDAAAVRRLAANPDYSDSIPAFARIEIASADRDWWALARLVVRNEWERFAPGPASLALFAGLCWFVFAVQAGQVDSPRGARWWLCLGGVLLGVASVWCTHMLIFWQELSWNLVESDDLVGGLRYFVLGVGLREELSKLLFLLPLVPFLVRRGNELEVLIVAACVGLGFAILENEHYFAATYGTAAVGRFLTANFFHMAATGLIGLALVRGIRDPRTRGPEAMALFGVVVFAHGLYDAAIVIPVLQEYSIASSIIYILLAYQFFHELRALRPQRTETISLTATFLCGISLLTAATFVYLSYQFGSGMAANMLVPEVLSTALMAYMFLREMPNTLVTV